MTETSKTDTSKTDTIDGVAEYVTAMGYEAPGVR